MSKKKKAEEAHHGGAWKVAYADFVTAMMALFMVLWISAQDDEILIATSQYFQNPFNSPLDATSGLLPELRSHPKAKAPADEASSDNSISDPDDIDLVYLNSVAQDFYRLLNVEENFEDRPIDIQVTSDGLRISLFDRSNRPIFKKDSAELTEWGDFVLQNLAWMIDRHRFRVIIEGHCASGYDLDRPDYSIWDLTSDRANTARRALTHYAVGTELIDRVSGLADRVPVPDLPPESESNQRVTLGLRVGHRVKTEKES